ncbi:hypothetical protein [Streptomyces sp. NPDC055055]
MGTIDSHIGFSKKRILRTTGKLPVLEKSMAGRIVLVYAKSITIDDVEACNSFLTERIARLASAERGSEERQAYRSIRAASLHALGLLQHSLPLSCQRVMDADKQILLHMQITTAWNTLWALVSPWQQHGNYDHERWRHVKYWDEEQEAQQHALLMRAMDKDTDT